MSSPEDLRGSHRYIRERERLSFCSASHINISQRREDPNQKKELKVVQNQKKELKVVGRERVDLNLKALLKVVIVVLVV